MNEKPSILGMIAETIGSILSTLGLMAIVTCFFGFLIAPVCGGWIENSMLKQSSLTDYPEVMRRMKYVRIMLWAICLASWALLFGLNLKF